MSVRQSHGRARVELPRSSELTDVEAVPTRTEGRDASGRFASGNPWASGARWRALIADGLGRDLSGQAGELGKRAHRLYRAFLADLPCDCASVRSLVQQRARAVALADAYAARGAELGLASEEGSAALSEAQKWCVRAERLAVSSLDLSNKLAAVAKRKPIDVHAQVAAVFGGET